MILEHAVRARWGAGSVDEFGPNVECIRKGATRVNRWNTTCIAQFGTRTNTL